MRLCVLVPTWRRPAELARCLSALAAQERTPDAVLVTMRRDDEETRNALAAMPRRPWGPEPVLVDVPGVVASMNAGFEAFDADVLCITDDDTVPPSDWLTRIERHFESDPRLGGLGGRDRLHGFPGVKTKPQRTVGRVRWFGRTIGNHHVGVGPAREVDVLKGANMSFRAAALRGRRLDDRLRGSGAQVHFEIALCLELKRAGWRLVYDPDAAVDHYPAARFADDQRNEPSLRALADEVHNETYGLLRWLPWWQKPLVLAYGLCVGTRRAPGLILTLEAVLRNGGSEGARKRLATSSRARLEAVSTFRAAIR